jgi:adenine-specific DNA-methyltransferase
VRLIKKLIDIIGLKPNDIILDFFAGSGTTAQAVIELNKQENKNIKFILVQNDEPINPKTTGYQFCLDNNLKTTISSLTLQKIRRVENGK